MLRTVRDTRATSLPAGVDPKRRMDTWACRAERCAAILRVRACRFAPLHARSVAVHRRSRLHLEDAADSAVHSKLALAQCHVILQGHIIMFTCKFDKDQLYWEGLPKGGHSSMQV